MSNNKAGTRYLITFEGDHWFGMEFDNRRACYEWIIKTWKSKRVTHKNLSLDEWAGMARITVMTRSEPQPVNVDKVFEVEWDYE